jgi:gamma-glutamyl hercynylcysteine S-oxide synthase
MELQQARRITDELFTIVRPESLYQRTIPERHRLIFYLGHLEAFDWNLIGRWGLSAPAFHEEFDRLFAFGIDPDESGLPQDRASDWPSLTEVASYNARVRETLDRLVGEAPAPLLDVAIEHRLMHAETFAYLLHNLGYTHKSGRAAPPPAGAGTPAAWVDIPGGEAVLGRPRGDGFGWDNEFLEHSVPVPPFRAGKHKVTNREYLRFVREGAPAPHFWVERDGRWMYRGMFGELPLPLDCPVYVTHEQATAYAAWAGAALPTEAQWHRAAEGARPSGNLDFRYWDPIPVDASPAGDSVWGVAQPIGNGWEWTSSVFEPFSGFEPFPFYRGYSADFFDGQHYVLKGASPRTAARLARRSFRNWFRPRYPYIYAAFRVVQN